MSRKRISPELSLSVLDIASRIRQIPDEANRARAALAFSARYKGRTDLLSIDHQDYILDPVKWVTEILGEYVWSKQIQILESVCNNRRTAVKSCHSAGKSFIAARVAAWWISCHPPGQAKVITSAPTGDQVRAILWQEIARAHSRGKLPGRLNQTEWWMPIYSNGTIREEMVGVGRKPADHNAAAFQGIHERFVLVLLDEADGIPKSLWDQTEGLLSNEECRLLSIGNPEDPTSEFFNECKPGSGTNVIRISAFDTPNFNVDNEKAPDIDRKAPENVRKRLVSRTWVEEKREKWGETNPLYISKVLGEFPEHNTDSLIPISWIRAAQQRTLPPALPVELGVDVGGGSDKSVIAVRQGPWVRIIHRDTNPDTMQTLSATLSQVKQWGAQTTKLDYIGIGKGAADRAKEMATDQRVKVDTPGISRDAATVLGVNVGMPARDKESFVNLRAEGYWTLRERFREGNIDIDPQDEDLAAQLADIKMKRSGGRIQIESKQEMKKRGKRSPDDADAVMLAFIDPTEKVQVIGGEWVR